ncbi:hypothetical protein Ami103574_05275 [Aminipila butyrica]|uniref:Uncharacterized protein n=1 Tax=Aminipila butyrica TaxID=433296 RepID=A0A858BUA1_9FIRM|nr:hypothetical protein [Aminipila butyrica]QIB68769.1 hypothetical protein Ami103574_05275 [Aminipila butyrica]
MAEVAITVTSGTPFNTDSSDSVLFIEVTNTEAIPCKPGTNAYYYISLSDGTADETYTFSVAQTGTIDPNQAEAFVVENTTLGTVTTSSGVIYYTAA